MYVFECKLSLVILCDSDFGITPVNDITIGITCASFCFHIAQTTFTSSWYVFCLSVIVLARLCILYYYYYYYCHHHHQLEFSSCSVWGHLPMTVW